jgi:MoaA/NifB/PqqE/SkfB family radical SAM enzyme
MLSFHYFYFLKHNLLTRFCGKSIPLLAGYKITHRCNLKCRSCPFWKIPSPVPTFPEVIQNIKKLRDDGIRLIIFEGGEPFLWRDGRYRLEDVILEAKKYFFCTGITTNGTLPIETSADTVWVSLDGLAETHNANRGVTFDLIMQNIAQSQHPNLLINVTINRLNVTEVPELIRFLAGKTKGITIQFYYPFPGTDDLWVPETSRIAVLDQLIELKRKNFPLLNSFSTLEGLKKNQWRCHPWLIGSVEPTGEINYGCYLQNRAKIACAQCGFAAHTELSKAYDWHIPSILAGKKIFKSKW